MKNNKKSLLNRLEQYSKQKIVPMHMPGHKRNIKILGDKIPWHLDITEIDDFDNLQNPNGILKESERLASKLWGSDASFLLVNGSTCGILSAINACVCSGDKVLIARNCHQSVYHAIELLNLNPVYLNPHYIESAGIWGSVDPFEVSQKLSEHRDIKLAVITSPTYEGVISDVKSISHILHSIHIPLIVDEAHGSHLGLSGGFPASALASGADIVINSLHKTLPSLTQTALMHIKGNLVCDDKIKHSVNIFQSSSPSYILMASIDNCIRFLTRDGEDLFLKFIKRLDSFYNSLIDMENFELFLPDTCTEVFAFDKSRLVILCKNTDYTGKKLMNTLQKDYGLQLEMSAPNYALAITGICDTDNSFDVLKTALKSVDRQTVYTAGKNKNYSVPPILCQEINPGKAINIDGRSISFDECAFKFSQEYVWMYPPGIPIIVPGQRVTQEVIDYLLSISQIGGEINSTSGGMPYTLKVINQTLI